MSFVPRNQVSLTTTGWADGNGYEVRVASHYSDHIRMVCKSNGAHWYADQKVWVFQITKGDIATGRAQTTLKLLLGDLRQWAAGEGWDFKADEATLQLWSRVKSGVLSVDLNGTDLRTLLQNVELRPHQIEALKFWVDSAQRALIAHEMGLGKTITTIAAMEAAKAKRTVVVCPEAMRLTWLRELQRTTKRPAFIYGRGDAFASNKWLQTENGVLIVGYALVYRLEEKVGTEYPFDMLVLDECHFIKNEGADRTKVSIKLAHRAQKVAALSGTPMINKPIELWPVLNALDSARFARRTDFGMTFCDPQEQPVGGYSFDGASNEEQLHELLSKGYMHRATKAEWLKDLPPKQRVLVPVDVSEADRKKYQAVEDGLPEEVFGICRGDKFDAALVSNKLQALRDMAVTAKLPQAQAWLESWLEQNPTKPLLVFAHHKKVVEAAARWIEGLGARVEFVHGDVMQSARDNAIDRFQNRQIDVLVATMDTMGTGVTLTAASDVVFLETGWTPAGVMQAEDRVHRIGQTLQVTIYYLVAVDTIDEAVVHLIHGKADTFQKIIDGGAGTLVNDPDGPITAGNAQQRAGNAVFADIVRQLHKAKQARDKVATFVGIDPASPAGDVSTAVTVTHDSVTGSLTIEKMEQAMEHIRQMQAKGLLIDSSIVNQILDAAKTTSTRRAIEQQMETLRQQYPAIDKEYRQKLLQHYGMDRSHIAIDPKKWINIT